MPTVTHMTMHPATWELVKNFLFILQERAYTEAQVNDNLANIDVKTSIFQQKGRITIWEGRKVRAVFTVGRCDFTTPATDARPDDIRPPMISTRN